MQPQDVIDLIRESLIVALLIGASLAPALLTTDARSWRVRPAEYAARWIRASVERRDALFATELDGPRRR